MCIRDRVKASVGGKLAQVGSRLVDGAARKMADEFFSAFRDYLTSDSGQSAGDAQSPVQIEKNSSEQAGAPRYESSGRGTIWIMAFVVLALAMLFAI